MLCVVWWCVAESQKTCRNATYATVFMTMKYWAILPAFPLK